MTSLRFSSTVDFLACSESSTTHQKKKSIGLRSGDRGGQTRKKK